MHSYYNCCYIDLELPLTDRESGKYAYEIVDIWYQVGLELGLDPGKLAAIKLNNLCRNEMAAIEMLMQWKQAKNNPPRRVLYKAVENCRTQAIRGMYLMYCNCTHPY